MPIQDIAAMVNRKLFRARPTSAGNDRAQQRNEEREPRRQRLIELLVEDGSHLFSLSHLPFHFPIEAPTAADQQQHREEEEREEGDDAQE